VLAVATAAAFCAHPARAACKRGFTFPIFQCSEKAWVAPPPEGAGLVSGVFWQIGYGNAIVNNGVGSSGTGVGPAGVFSGNDSGLRPVTLRDAGRSIGDPNVPRGALCVDPLNWSDEGVDGCCDNVRDPNQVASADAILNPQFDPRSEPKDGVFVRTLEKIQDYPMAVLLREDTGRYFAAAVVATSERGESLEEYSPGDFSFADVRDGESNALSGEKNVIPWQKVPEARLEVTGRSKAATSAGGGAGGPSWRARVTWDPVRMPSDLSRRPSEAYRIDSPGRGVGTADMGPLVAYRVEAARLTELMIGTNGYPMAALLLWDPLETTTETETILDFPEDTCVRIAVHFGTQPRTRSVSPADCALGHCGDVGYSVTGPPVCIEGDLLRGASRGPGPG
jgi:hypothetical protein